MVDHTPRTVAEITKNPDAKPPEHACDNPDLNALEFLLAVMHDRTFPLSVRMKAAEGAVPYFTPRAGETRHYPCVDYHCTYVIPDNPALLQGSSTEGPEQNNEKSQSFSPSASDNPHPQCGDPRPYNIERPFPDLSFEQICELIRTTDFDNLPVCECGHRMPFPCKPVRTN